ncbi:hypothetical protein BDD12DRAFT_896152 [Trichophaea hybrida]|nr:hypothetical protein BDD12DRAFT_896152 [Trichophaea hybrida]
MSNPASTTSTSAAALTEPQSLRSLPLKLSQEDGEEDAAAAGEREDEGDWTEENEMEAAN